MDASISAVFVMTARTARRPAAENEPQTPVRGARAPRPSGIVAALGNPYLAGVLCLAALAYAAAVISELTYRANRWDFSHYYVSALALRSGVNPYTHDLTVSAKKLGLAIGIISHATYPPTFLLCFEPLTLLRPAPAYWIWMGLNIVFLAAALYLLLNREAGIGGGLAWSLAALAVFYEPLEDHFYYAQTQILILLLLVLMMRALRRRHDAAAGLILAFAVLLKAFPIIIAGYLIVRRRWRALLWLCAGLAIGGFATLGFAGVRTSFDFLYGARAVTSHHWLARPANVSIDGLVSRMVWRLGGVSPAWAAARHLTVAAIELIVLGLTIWVSVGGAHDEDHGWRALSVWVAAAVMLSPTAWIHYMVLLLIPFAAIVSASLANRIASGALWLALASYLLFAIGTILLPSAAHGSHRALAAIVVEYPGLSLLLAYAGACLFASRGAEHEEVFRPRPSAAVDAG